LDREVYSINALESSWKNAKLDSEREHVFPYIQNNPEKFTFINFRQEKDYSNLRWTIDHACDFQMTEKVYEYLYDQKPVFLQHDILELLEKHPEIAEINEHIKRKKGYLKTVHDEQNLI
jgi:spore coat polysaccharide biosynthesis protein SpsF